MILSEMWRKMERSPRATGSGPFFVDGEFDVMRRSWYSDESFEVDDLTSSELISFTGGVQSGGILPEAGLLGPRCSTMPSGSRICSDGSY